MLASIAHVMKKLLQEIPKGALNTMGVALGVLLLSLGSKAIRSALGLSLSDTEVSSIQFWLLIVGIGTFLSVGWFLFFRIRHKLRLVEQRLHDSEARLEEALKPVHHFLDDFNFDQRLGIYKHKTKPEFYCASCIPKDVLSPLKVQDNGWMCQIRGCEKFHRNPDYREPPYQPIHRPGYDLRPGIDF